jgi:hypothetical protein
MAVGECSDHGRQQLRGMFDGRRDAQSTAQVVAARAGLFQGFLHAAQEGGALVEQALPCIRQRDAACRPVEQRRPERGFDPPDLKTDLWAGNAESLRSPGEAAELRDGDECSQQIEVVQGLSHDW